MLATEPCGAPHWEHTSRPPRDRSARQSREPHCKQTDVFDTRPVVRNGDPWLELQAVEAWLQSSCVFNNLTLQFNLGEHTAVLGPNGSGKSTLVRLIDRSIHPVVKPGSHLRLFGSPLPLEWELRRRIGLVSSDVEARVPFRPVFTTWCSPRFMDRLGFAGTRSRRGRGSSTFQDCLTTCA